MKDRDIASVSSWTASVLLLLSVLYLGLGYIRSESGLVHAFDTGLYLQILSNLQAGHGWASSITGETQFLGHHFQPVLALLVPFHSVMGSSFSLLLLDWIVVLATTLLLIVYLPKSGLCSIAAAQTIGLAFFLHPALASRMYYSFVPEVLALPGLCYLAMLLAKKDEIQGRQWIWLILSVLGVALCKETLWLTSGWVSILLALKYRKNREARFLLGLGVLCFSIFLYLFLIWMPAHSNLSEYYGLSYYQNSWVAGRWDLFGKILGAFLNIFSGRSLWSALIFALAIPVGLVCIGSGWALAGALPAIAIVMAASHQQIHDLSNHYLLAALPFLSVSSAVGLNRLLTHIANPKVRIYLCIAVLGVPGAVMIMHNSGFLFQTMFAAERMSFDLTKAASALKKDIHPEDLILIDGSLQPLFSDLPNVKVILGFQGNPSKVTQEDLQRTKHIITTNDLSALTDCLSVKPGEGDLTVFDYPGFYQYCEWLKKSRFEKHEYIPGRLVHLKIENNIIP